MYKKMDAAQRCDQLQTLAFQLDVLEGAADEQGPFIAGGPLRGRGGRLAACAACAWLAAAAPPWRQVAGGPRPGERAERRAVLSAEL